MSTLAASFMADFDDVDEEEQLQSTIQQQAAAAASSASSSSSVAVKQEPGTEAAAAEAGGEEGEEGESDEDEAMGVKQEGAEEEEILSGPVEVIPAVPTFSASTPLPLLRSLLQSSKLQDELRLISSLEAASASGAPIDKEAEYPHIVYANSLSFEIDSHLVALHKVARDLYAPRYSELEQLLSNPLEYARVASLLGNESDMGVIGKLLQGVTGLPNNVALTISVTATTTRGKPLPPDQLQKLRDVCDTMLQLDAAKARLHAYIRSRMEHVAPNVSAMLGTDLAARVVSLAGGVKKLAEIPACNLQVLGKRGRQATGLSRIAQAAHEGLIAQAAVMADVPSSLRARALRLLAGKVALAARLDSFAEEGDSGAKGESLLEEVREKIAKWQEAPAQLATKALPVPLSKPKPRRGGRRARKEKERNAQTEVAKMRNRLFMDKVEIVDEYTGEGMGALGQEGTGVLRVAAKDAKLAKRLSQKTQARLKRIGGVIAAGASVVPGQATSIGGAAAGTASSIAFTPAQGMQLVKKETVQRLKTSDSYFDNTTSFLKVKKENGDTPAANQQHAGVKRQLPPVPLFGAGPPAGAAAAAKPDGPAEKKQKL